jgi:hypothetical protein
MANKSPKYIRKKTLDFSLMRKAKEMCVSTFTDVCEHIYISFIIIIYLFIFVTIASAYNAERMSLVPRTGGGCSARTLRPSTQPNVRLRILHRY